MSGSDSRMYPVVFRIRDDVIPSAATKSIGDKENSNVNGVKYSKYFPSVSTLFYDCCFASVAIVA